MKFLQKVSIFLFFLCIDFHFYGNPVFDFIQDKGLACTKQVLRSGSEEFPCNVIAEFGEQSPQTLNFLVAQADFHHFFGGDQLDTLTERLATFPKRVRLVVTANSFSPAAPNPFSPPGSGIWMDSVSPTENATIVFLRRNSDHKVIVYSAANKSVSPLFITRAAVDALLEIDAPYSVANFLQRYETTGFDKGLSLALRGKHSAVSVGLSSQHLVGFIWEMSRIFSQGFSGEMDTHYLVLNFIHNCFFITEMMIVVSLLLFLGIPLFFTTVFAFLRRNDSLQNWSNLKKILPIIPILLIFMTVSLILGRVLAKKIIVNYQQHAFLALSLNLAISGIFFSLIIFFRRILHFTGESYVYSFLLMTFSLLNVFVFSEINLTLFSIFLGFYLFSVIFSTSKNILFKFIFLLLTCTAILLRFRGLQSHELQMFSQFILNASLKRTILFSMILIPCILVFMQFFMWLKTVFKGLTFAKLILFFCLTAFLSATGMVIFVQTASDETFVPVKTENPMGNFSLSSESTDFFDQQKITLNIISKNKAIYYDVELSAQDGIAVYESNFPFESISTADSNNTVKILLDENPPEDFSVEYVCDYEKVNKAVVLGYFLNSQGEIFTESKEVLFDARL